ncbi:hypothetical protein BDV26DRAFT_288914 [Aspergillus bertholletiae]|uniref:GST N-terminal domain-containing protein n=1 Tax=Aspergillus bertholletiae TaxID=1226010 RepID=A0A5N7BJM9_9EURO|nr:hypothetical protein BDV26DRAFT_288914 [Aspergillus bertholletiae]
MLLRFYRKLRGRDDSGPCLYLFPFSLSSIMVQFTIAVALQNKFSSSRELTKIKYLLVNLHRNENLGEDYLLRVNPKGKVPALTAKSIPAPLTDSLSISYWVCEQQPSLIPETHRTTIQRLLSQLHRIQTDNNPNPVVDDLLARNDISPQYRRALEYKRDCDRKQIEPNLDNKTEEGMTDQARRLFSEVVVEYRKFSHGGMWIFGDKTGPTVLDTHVVVFIVRLIDIHLEDLVPRQLQTYAKAIMELPEWKTVMRGMPTIWNPSLGPIDQL